MKFLSENKWISKLLAAVVFLYCLWLIITGQKVIGIASLLKMLVGLCGLLVLLYCYNKPYQGK